VKRTFTSKLSIMLGTQKSHQPKGLVAEIG
jgi:hypothetical protein